MTTRIEWALIATVALIVTKTLAMEVENNPVHFPHVIILVPYFNEAIAPITALIFTIINQMNPSKNRGQEATSMTAIGNKTSAQSTAAHFGGIEAMFDLMEKSKRSHEWLEVHEKELVEQYPDRWVAVDQNGLIATASTQIELIEKIKKEGINVKTTAMRLMETEPTEMIF